MSNRREELIDWLRDAYAMERGLEITLKKESENDELHAGLRAQARLHLEETRGHAEAVKGCLEQLGAETSALKTGMAQFMEAAKGITTKFARDERVKDVLVAYASEHFEIACYRALRVTAEMAGEPEIAAVCDRIIAEEQRMAGWISENLPIVVSEYLTDVSLAKA